MRKPTNEELKKIISGEPLNQELQDIKDSILQQKMNMQLTPVKVFGDRVAWVLVDEGSGK